MDYKGYMRRKLLDEMYDKMSADEKRLFVQMTMQNKSNEEILQALQSQKNDIEDIRRRQSWWLDLSANVVGSGIYDLAMRMFRMLK